VVRGVEFTTVNESKNAALLVEVSLPLTAVFLGTNMVAVKYAVNYIPLFVAYWRHTVRSGRAPALGDPSRARNGKQAAVEGLLGHAWVGSSSRCCPLLVHHQDRFRAMSCSATYKVAERSRKVFHQCS
jgi:hypothetical protein